ncbi:MAG: hypothetical protein ABIX01_01725 [Chitinophagaceae bacterium]
MKNIFTPFFLLCSMASTAQITENSQWTLMKGSRSNMPIPLGQYGVQGVAATTNTPGGRENSVSWKDNAGNLWLFGGGGVAAVFNPAILNDLWKYNPLINMWTWMKGDNTVSSFGVYGVRGIAAVTNKPGARSGSVSWTDGNGNLWMFGSYGHAASTDGDLNDMWKYSPSTNMWTWMKGDSTVGVGAVYGTSGIEADSVRPPAGVISSVSWADGSGSLWLYYVSDFWKYNTATNRWTWIKGKGSNSKYGSQGIPDTANTPGPRRAGCPSWMDNTGNVWVFFQFGDLWKYYPAINQWAWIRDTSNAAGYLIRKYGTKGVSAPANHPGSRFGAVSWKDNFGKFWLYGGGSIPSGVTQHDLWKYDPSNNEWVWIKGDSTGGGVNEIPDKVRAVSWIDESGTPWIFGGVYNPASFTNDLWKLGNAVGPISTEICPGGSTTLTAASVGNAYQWQVNTGSGFVNLPNGDNYSGVNTITIQLINMPSSIYGYQYQCLVNGIVNSNLFKLAFTSTYSGAIAGAWENTANWSCGAIPDANTDVIINSGSPMVNSNRSCRSVYLKPGTLLTVKSGFTLTLTGK